MNIPWPIFTTEMGLIVLALGCFIVETFLPRRENGRVLTNIALIGTATLIAFLGYQWNYFGTAFFGSFLQDGFSYFFKMFILLTGFFILYMTHVYQDELKRGKSEFVLLILFSLIGMSFLVSANDFLLFFVALETVTVSLLVITAYLRDDERSIEAGTKYLILVALSTAFLVYGLSFIYGATGSLSFPEIQKAVLAFKGTNPTFMLGMTLVFCSLAFKIAVFPFHFWAPDVYEGAPTPLTAFFAIGSKGVAIAVLLRLLTTVFLPIADTLIILFAIIAALSIIYGNLAAIPQTNIKRLLAYSSIGHAGYLFIGFATFWQSGKEAILFYLLSYLFSTAGAFLVVVWVSTKIKSDRIADYAGLAQKSPILAAGMLLALMSLAGLPPLAGFFGKFYLVLSAVQSGLIWLAIIGAVNVVISLYYYLRVVQTMYFETPADAEPMYVATSQKFMQYFSMAGILVMGIFPGPIVQFIRTVLTNT